MKPSQSEIHTHLKDILEIPERIKNYDVLLKKELLLHTENRIIKILGSINNTILANSNYEYPKEYLPNKKFQYWGERVNQVFNYYELQFLKEIITISLRASESSTPGELKEPECYPFKQIKVLVCFDEYTQKHIIDSYSDYSYLFQRLLKEKLIYPVKQKEFMQWLFDNQYIKEPTYKEFLSHNQFKSLRKSYSDSRINNFHNIFTNYI